MSKLVTLLKCESCNSSHLTNENGYITCRSCGVIHDRHYENQTAKINKNGELETQNYIGKTPNFVGGLGSQIGLPSGYIKSDNMKIIRKFRRLNKYNQKSKLISQATEFRTLTNFNKVCSYLNIPNDIKNDTLYYFNKYKAGRKITNHMLLISVSLIFSVKKEKYPLTIKSIKTAFLKFGYRVQNTKDLLLQFSNSFEKLQLVKSENFILKYASDISNDEEIRKRLAAVYEITPGKYMMLLEKISLKFLSKLKQRRGLKPSTYGAAVVYLSDRIIGTKINRSQILSQNSISKILNTSESVLRDMIYNELVITYNEFLNSLMELVDLVPKEIIIKPLRKEKVIKEKQPIDKSNNTMSTQISLDIIDDLRILELVKNREVKSTSEFIRAAIQSSYNINTSLKEKTSQTNSINQAELLELFLNDNFQHTNKLRRKLMLAAKGTRSYSIHKIMKRMIKKGILSKFPNQDAETVKSNQFGLFKTIEKVVAYKITNQLILNNSDVCKSILHKLNSNPNSIISKNELILFSMEKNIDSILDYLVNKKIIKIQGKGYSSWRYSKRQSQLRKAVYFRMPEEAVNQLKIIVENSEYTSYAELIRKAVKDRLKEYSNKYYEDIKPAVVTPYTYRITHKMVIKKMEVNKWMSEKDIRLALNVPKKGLYNQLYQLVEQGQVERKETKPIQFRRIN